MGCDHPHLLLCSARGVSSAESVSWDWTMKRVRPGSAKPTARTADLPFQSEGRRNIRPNDTWSLLTVKIWRLRQRVAARLRRLVAFWKKILGLYRQEVSNLPNGARPQVVALANLTVNGHLQLRSRFVPASQPDQTVIIRGGLVGDSAVQLRSTLARRTLAATRVVGMGLYRGVETIVQSLRGQQCLWCGSLFHSATGCLSDFERNFFREAESIDLAISRMRDPTIRESDWSDDFIRIGVARLAMRRAQNSRLIGMLFWFGCFARHCARVGGLGIFVQLLRYPVLANELWRVLTGSAVLPTPPRSRLLLHRIWGSDGLYDFAYQELRRMGISVQGPGPETVGGATTSVVPAVSNAGDATSALRNIEGDTVSQIAANMVLANLWETQLKITDVYYALRRVSPYAAGLLADADLPLATFADRKATVCPTCGNRAWKGSTCEACLLMKPSVLRIDSRLWRARSHYRSNWLSDDEAVPYYNAKMSSLLTQFRTLEDTMMAME